jgi:hypothetical protein
VSELREERPSDGISKPSDASPRDPVADAPHWSREHFIPIRRSVLVRLLAEEGDLDASEKRKFLQLARMVTAMFHHDFQTRLERLKEAYAPFNADDDTRSLETWDDERRTQLRATIFQDFAHLLRCANYHRLSPEEVEQAVGTATDWGVRLRVDFSQFDRLDVYARGDVIGLRERRSWRRWFRREKVGVPMFQRCVVIFCFHAHSRAEEGLDVAAVHLKLFKNVPKLDVDMLLPGSQVRMTLMDQGKILFPTLSGAAITITKLLKGALWMALAGTFWGLVAFFGIVVGAFGYGIRSFLGYQRTKDKYQLNLTRSRYYQQLDNNAGVIYRILDEAEEQETRETLIAYFLLWKRAPGSGWTEEELTIAAESYLLEKLGVPVDFECHDALDKAVRLGISEPTPDGRYRALPLESAILKLDHGDGGFRARKR